MKKKFIDEKVTGIKEIQKKLKKMERDLTIGAVPL